MARSHRVVSPVIGSSLVCAVVATWLGFGAQAHAQQVEEFYRGKQIDMVIGYSPGGTYDLYARLVARFLGNYIPGKPKIVPRNMPGAGSRAAVRWVYTVAPKDGSVLATADQSLSVEQAMGDKNSRLRHHQADLYRQRQCGQQHDVGLVHVRRQDDR